MPFIIPLTHYTGCMRKGGYGYRLYTMYEVEKGMDVSGCNNNKPFPRLPVKSISIYCELLLLCHLFCSGNQWMKNEKGDDGNDTKKIKVSMI